MQQLIRINEIKARADALRITMKELCAETEPVVPTSTVSRWLGGDSGANLGKYDSFCTLLEAALDRLEISTLKQLAARHPDQVTA